VLTRRFIATNESFALRIATNGLGSGMLSLPTLRCAAIVRTIIACATVCVGGCGGSDGGSGDASRVDVEPVTSADITLLFMGNSHTSANDLTGMVAAMVRAARPGKTVTSIEAPGWMFLEERLHHAPSLALLKSQRWSAVVLQAQKYSTSGQFSYSTVEAEEFIRMIRAQSALPVMFPEWPQRNVDETHRIYDLHVSIAQKQPACVAPIGQAWDLALARQPSLTLHAADGNHSAPAGAFLAALVIFTTLTNASALEVPHLAQFSIDAQTQAALREIAAETVQTVPPRQWCPGDVSI
jgi:hypothetical protein